MLNFGNKIDHWGGPRWSPYAQAIADHYAIQVPFYLTMPTNLTAAGQQRIILSEPYHHDCLLFGAHVNIGSDAVESDNGQQTFLSVADLESGMNWVTPGFPDAAPVTAFGGSQSEVMPLMALPEAFFLPALTQLKHEWRSFSLATSGGTITWAGVQLIAPKDGQRPQCVTMPDGNSIRIGGRLPWFDVVGLGLEQEVAGQPIYTLVDDIQFEGYSSAVDCDVEIHGLNCNFFTDQGVSLNPDQVKVQIADEGDRRMWGLNFAPIPAVFGGFEQVFPSLPFTKPYLLRAGRRLQISVLNESGVDISEGYVTIRGVKLCAY